MSIIAKESGHYYEKDGTPAYTQPNKSKPGESRSTTLRDAKKLNLVPSVTTILKVLAAPGLEIWKQNQILESALTLPKIEGEGVYEFGKRIKADSQEHAKQARDKGTKVHGLLEKYFKSGKQPADFSRNLDDGEFEIILSTNDEINKFFRNHEWNAEKSFSSKLGYGGKIDLHSDTVVIDFKTKEFSQEDIDKNKIKGWDEQVMQLAAYGHGLGLSDFRCANVFISVNNPGLVYLHEWYQSEIGKGYEMFLHALGLWKLQKNYTP